MIPYYCMCVVISIVVKITGLSILTCTRVIRAIAMRRQQVGMAIDRVVCGVHVEVSILVCIPASFNLFPFRTMVWKVCPQPLKSSTSYECFGWRCGVTMTFAKQWPSTQKCPQILGVLHFTRSFWFFQCKDFSILPQVIFVTCVTWNVDKWQHTGQSTCRLSLHLSQPEIFTCRFLAASYCSEVLSPAPCQCYT